MAVKRKRMTILDSKGEALDVPVRCALPVTAKRVRYPGFKQEQTVLKAGSVRMPGYLPLTCDIVLERDVAVSLRDGTTIYVDVFRPDDDLLHPAIIAMSPYGKQVGGQWLDDIPGRAGVKRAQTSGLHKFEGPDPAYWVKHGYAVVNPDVRGAYSSEGVILFFGSGYGRDGADIVEWSAAQPWSNGRVGMSGNSWLAISQWFTAAERPEHLCAIAPWEGLTNSLTQVATHGGVPTAEFVEMLSDTFASTPEGGIEDSIVAMGEHPTMDAYWEDKAARLERIEVPAYVVASWTNMIHTYGTFEAWQRISSTKKWLRVHNTNEWHDYYTPESMDDLRRFFDRYLKGEENGWESTPRVRLSLLNPGGEDVVNRLEEGFPLARTQYRRLYLDARNTSFSDEPINEPASITYDSSHKRARAVFEMRLDESIEICGYISLRLWVSPLDADDMDLHVLLDKKGPLGSTYHGSVGSDPVASGFMRVSMRELDPERSSEENPVQTMRIIQKVSPGEVVPVDISIWPMGMIFEKGQTLRLTIEAFKTAPQPSKLMTGVFGHAKVKVPSESFTYLPDARPKMMRLGGNSSQVAPDAEDAPIPQDVNEGRHRIFTGGNYASSLYLPFIPTNKRIEDN